MGDISTAVIIAELAKAGKTVLLLFGDNRRYDLVIEENGSFSRIQCKTGRVYRGAVKFASSSSQAHRGKGRQSYDGQIEAFAVYCPQTDKVYMVPIDDAASTETTLRIEPPKGIGGGKVRYAKDYEFHSGVV